MSGLKKFVYVIYGIIVLLTVFLTYLMIFDYGGITQSLRSISGEEWFYYLLTVLAIITAIGAFIFFIVGIAAPSLKNYLRDTDKMGELYISKAAIESNVRSTANQYPEVRDTNVEVDIKNGETPSIYAYLDCGSSDQAVGLDALGTELKAEVKRSLEEFTGYPVSNVKVKFFDIKKNNNRRVV